MKLHTTDKILGGGLILRTLSSVLGPRILPFPPTLFALPDMSNGFSGNCQGLKSGCRLYNDIGVVCWCNLCRVLQAVSLDFH